MSRRVLRPIARLARTASAHARGARAYAAGTPRDGVVRVSYGMRVHEPSEITTGGMVKLQSLSQAFPEQATRFNILYLVSSRLPNAPEALADWARRKGAKVVLNQNGVAYPAWYGDGWQQVNAPMAALLERADHVFYQSRFCQESADRFAAKAAGDTDVLHNPVDLERFTPAPPSAARPLTLLLGGSQDQWYRLESALQALALLARGGLDAHLVVTGRFGWTRDAKAARHQVDTLLDSLGVRDRVRFTGPYTQAEAPSVFHSGDVLLHTKYNDPCPTVVLEAMASGLPVVYSRSGGVGELVGDGAGIGIDVELSWERDVPLPPAAIAEAVHLVCRDRLRYAAAARDSADRFDVRRWLDKHREVFTGLVTRA